MKTDNEALVGQHKFELAGLGKAPFKFVAMSVNTITYPDGTTKAGGTCDYCSTGISNEFHIKSADGKLSKVGCNCIEKVGDKGLLQAYKSSPEFRRAQALKRQAKDALVTSELKKLIADNSEKLASQPHPHGFIDRETKLPLTRLDHCKYVFGICGAAGRAQMLKGFKNGFWTSEK